MTKETFKNLGYLAWHGSWVIWCMLYITVKGPDWWWLLVIPVLFGSTSAFAETFKKL